MKQYRAKQKQNKEQTKTANYTPIQTAIRNKLARNALLKQKQDVANEIMSKINQQKKEQDKQQLFKKLNTSVYAKDMLKNIFEYLLLSISQQAPKKRGRPLGSTKIKIEKYLLFLINFFFILLNIFFISFKFLIVCVRFWKWLYYLFYWYWLLFNW